MKKWYDNNGTELNIGDSVMCILGGTEIEATIVKLLDNNLVKIEGAVELMDVDASDCYLLP